MFPDKQWEPAQGVSRIQHMLSGSQCMRWEGRGVVGARAPVDGNVCALDHTSGLA